MCCPGSLAVARPLVEVRVFGLHGVRSSDHSPRVDFSRRDLADLSRSVGGLALALASVVLLSRGERDGWSGFVRMLVVLLPTAVLYLLAIGRRGGPPRDDDLPASHSPTWGRRGSGAAAPWRSVLGVAALLLAPIALLAFLHWAGVRTARPLVQAGVFAMSAVIAGYAVFAARIAYAALLAGLSGLVAWLIVWGQILDHPSPSTYRGLLIAAGALLVVLAALLAARGSPGASELATAGGLAAIAAGIIGIVIGAFVGVFGSLFGAVESSSSSGSARVGVATSPQLHGTHLPGLLTGHTSGLQSFGWDLYLLVASLALVWVGSRMRARGLGYVGGVGLLGFLISVGAQVTRLEAGRSPSGSIVGWPLALLIVGLVGLLAPALLHARLALSNNPGEK